MGGQLLVIKFVQFCSVNGIDIGFGIIVGEGVLC